MLIQHGLRLLLANVSSQIKEIDKCDSGLPNNEKSVTTVSTSLQSAVSTTTYRTMLLHLSGEPWSMLTDEGLQRDEKRRTLPGCEQASMMWSQSGLTVTDIKPLMWRCSPCYHYHLVAVFYIGHGHGHFKCCYHRQPDVFQFLEDVPPLIQETSSVPTNWREVAGF